MTVKLGRFTLSPFGRRRLFQLSLPVFFLLGLVAGWVVVQRQADSEIKPAGAHEVRQGGYQFINPLLECDTTEGGDTRELKPFKYKVEAMVRDKLATGEAFGVSVYFRDLDNGPWFGLNEDVKFSPASLLKVPVMMGYLKLAETAPEVLQTKIRYKGDFDLAAFQFFAPRQHLEPGKFYTVDELIYRMIAYSDNNAYELLLRNIDTDYLDQILADLNIEHEPAEREDILTVKTYSGFFRVLYNASYLNKQMSEKALECLSHDFFNVGIIAGVPPGTTVASKFGEWAVDEQSGIKQLHEFGIVYHPEHPYLLGIMTRGHDIRSLAGVIQDISRLIYEEIEAQHSQSHRHYFAE